MSGLPPAIQSLLDFLLPTGCVCCRAWIPAGGARAIVCDRCRTRLAEASWPRCPRCHAPTGTGRDDAADCLECRDWPAELSRARYAHVLAPPATDLIHALKYEGWGELAALMGGVMAHTAREHLPRPEHRGGSRVVVPVPTTDRRLKARGYNQARLLAEVVAGELGLPILGALVRRKAPTSQTTLSPRARRENVRDAFDAVHGLRGAHVLLVDDVLTTGATAGEAARTLTGAGAGDVSLVAYGRALPGALDRSRPAA